MVVFHQGDEYLEVINIGICFVQQLSALLVSLIASLLRSA